MAHYDDIILPPGISFQSQMGPTTSSQIIFTNSGYRKVNQRWSQKLRKFNIGYGVKKPQDAYEILKIFEAVEGPTHSFLMLDWADWNTTDGLMGEGSPLVTATDQPLYNTVTGLAEGDGSTKTFQMYKRYAVGTQREHARKIQKPKNGTVLVSVDGVTKTVTTHYSVNYSTGVVTFVTAPAGGSPSTLPKWGGEFYVPVAFTSDEFVTAMETFDGNAIPNIELMEVRL
jgi:uncharacterized protein (TIGR02217 family)